MEDRGVWHSQMPLDANHLSKHPGRPITHNPSRMTAAPPWHLNLPRSMTSGASIWWASRGHASWLWSLEAPSWIRLGANLSRNKGLTSGGCTCGVWHQVVGSGSFESCGFQGEASMDWTCSGMFDWIGTWGNLEARSTLELFIPADVKAWQSVLFYTLCLFGCRCFMSPRFSIRTVVRWSMPFTSSVSDLGVVADWWLCSLYVQSILYYIFHINTIRMNYFITTN